MALGSGLSAQIGYVQESSYGASGVPTRFLPFVSESLKYTIGRDEAGDLGETTTTARSDRWLPGKQEVGGSVTHIVYDKGFGLLFKNMLGASASGAPLGVSSPPRTHTSTLATLFGSSLGVQVGRPDVAATVHPFTYRGCKVTEWELSNARDGFLQLALTLAGQTEVTSQALASASYAASTTPLSWTGASLTRAGSAFIGRVTDISIKGTTGHKADRFGLATTALMLEPIQEEVAPIEGEVTCEFNSLTDYARFVAGTQVAIVANWQGPLITGTTYAGVQITLAVCRFDGETPNVDGPGRLSIKLPFAALNNGSAAPISLVYTTTDTTP